MIQISVKNREQVITAIKDGSIDAADLGEPSFVDETILNAHRKGVLERISGMIEDKRSANKSIPQEIIIALSIAAKMKQHTSLTDIPYAITDAETLAELGYAMWDSDRDVSKGLFDEGSLRHLLGKYESVEFINGYNRCVQGSILPHVGMSASIHHLDCTKLEVALNNEHYEQSSVITDKKINKDKA